MAAPVDPGPAGIRDRERLHSNKFGRIDFEPGLFLVSWVSASALPVRPGDDLRITWSFDTFAYARLVPGAVRARIYVGDYTVPLFEGGPVPLGPVQFGFGTGDQLEVIPAPPLGGMTYALYKVGQVKLRVEIVSDVTGDTFEGTAWLDVLPSLSPGWTWNLPPDGTVNDSAPAVPAIFGQPRFDLLINHDYTLSGHLDGQGGGQVSGTFTLLEQRPESPDPVPIESRPFMLTNNERFDGVFATLKKNWSWIISGIWVFNPSEPMTKFYHYSISVSFSDAFNNSYPEQVVSLVMGIDIGVNDEKRAYGNAALAALGVGIILSILTFGGAGAAAQAVAKGLGEKALDPPAPDHRFRKPPPEPRPPDPVDIDGEPALSGIAGVIALSGYMLNLIQALDDCDNRSLGAELYGDQTAMRLQRTTQRHFAEQLDVATRKLVEHSQSLVQSLEGGKLVDEKIEPMLRVWQRSGIPAKFRSELAPAVAAEIERGIENEEVCALIVDPVGAVCLLTQSMVIAARDRLGRIGFDRTPLRPKAKR